MSKNYGEPTHNARHDMMTLSHEDLEAMYYITINKDGSVIDGPDWFESLDEWAEIVDEENAETSSAFSKMGGKSRYTDE